MYLHDGLVLEPVKGTQRARRHDVGGGVVERRSPAGPQEGAVEAAPAVGASDDGVGQGHVVVDGVPDHGAELAEAGLPHHGLDRRPHLGHAEVVSTLAARQDGAVPDDHAGEQVEPQRSIVAEEVGIGELEVDVKAEPGQEVQHLVAYRHGEGSVPAGHEDAGEARTEGRRSFLPLERRGRDLVERAQNGGRTVGGLQLRQERGEVESGHDVIGRARRGRDGVEDAGPSRIEHDQVPLRQDSGLFRRDGAPERAKVDAEGSGLRPRRALQGRGAGGAILAEISSDGERKGGATASLSLLRSASERLFLGGPLPPSRDHDRWHGRSAWIFDQPPSTFVGA